MNSVPKKMEKFNNFVTNSFKINDSAVSGQWLYIVHTAAYEPHTLNSLSIMDIVAYLEDL